MHRRDFVAVCVGCTAIGLYGAPQAGELRVRRYARARLVDARSEPVRLAGLAPSTNYIFHYPYRGTPCFLLNLGKPTAENVVLRTGAGDRYEWTGGVGPQRSIVAYSAICTHRLTYPTRQISFISYREQSTAPVARQNTIHCCSEHSEYDPARGARVVNGPAPQPLAAVMLEYDRSNDTLYASGVIGADIYAAFFEKYALRLELDYGAGRANLSVGDSTQVTELTHYCKQQVRC